MQPYFDSLTKSVVFKSLSIEQIKNILENIFYSIKSYDKDDIIAIEGDKCTSLGIILRGNIEIHKSFPSGKLVTINHFTEGNIFGEALIFSNRNNYPATIVSSSHTEIIYIAKEDIINMMTIDSNILDNFMQVLSNRILMLNDRLTNLSLDTLRKKISNVLLLEQARQKSMNIILPYSRKKMAQLLNVPRPSLSRELINMKDDGLIDFYKNKVKILDFESLQESLS